MKIYVTKYALTQGIYEVEAEDETGGIFVAFSGSNRSYTTYYHKGEYELTHAAAVTKANEMREKKIASLKKQIKKLEEMTFV